MQYFLESKNKLRVTVYILKCIGLFLLQQSCRSDWEFDLLNAETLQVFTPSKCHFWHLSKCLPLTAVLSIQPCLCLFQ